MLHMKGEKTTGVNQPDPERVLPKPSDSLKTNTLQIRYTKLEFKVIFFQDNTFRTIAWFILSMRSISYDAG